MNRFHQYQADGYIYSIHIYICIWIQLIIFLYLIPSFLFNKSLLVPYGCAFIELIDYVMLPSLAVDAIRLTSSANSLSSILHF